MRRKFIRDVSIAHPTFEIIYLLPKDVTRANDMHELSKDSGRLKIYERIFQVMNTPLYVCYAARCSFDVEKKKKLATQ